MGKILTLYVAVLLSAVAMQSCSSSGCTENKSSIPLAGFYDSATKRALQISGVNISGVGAESLLLGSSEQASQVYMPLRSSQPSTAFYLNYATDTVTGVQLNDTIVFDYKSIPYFVSEECGAMYYYEITDMRHTGVMIDSVRILDRLITNTDVERIKIYFRTDETVE